jgi:hypothetical protein
MVTHLTWRRRPKSSQRIAPGNNTGIAKKVQLLRKYIQKKILT